MLAVPPHVLAQHVVSRLPPASAARFRAASKHARAAVPRVPPVTVLAVAVARAMATAAAAARAGRDTVVGPIDGRWVTAITHAGIHTAEGTVEVHWWGEAWVVKTPRQYRMPADMRHSILEAADVARVRDVRVTTPGRLWTSRTPRLV